jgi:hypothetical protein
VEMSKNIYVYSMGCLRLFVGVESIYSRFVAKGGDDRDDQDDVSTRRRSVFEHWLGLAEQSYSG